MTLVKAAIDLRLQVREGILQQVANESSQELLVARSHRSLIWLVDGALDLGFRAISRLDEVEHPRQ